MRVSTFPTLHGERAVVRLFGGSRRYQRLRRPRSARGRAGAAAKRCWAKPPGRSSFPGRPAAERRRRSTPACGSWPGRPPASAAWSRIEDPIEVAVEGVAQSQVRPAAGLDLAVGLRFLMRQDPEVIMVGEIRDRATAEAALQASLTGHLVLSTFHAGSAAETVGRLLDMGIEPYVLRSGLLAVLNQRLLRRLCTCAEATDDADARLGLPVSASENPPRLPGLPRHRLPGAVSAGRNADAVAERVGSRDGPICCEAPIGPSRQMDAVPLVRASRPGSMVSRWRACLPGGRPEGLTSPAEVRRLLGFSTMLPADVGKGNWQKRHP